MGNNGLIDPKPCLSSACCFSRPVQCPAAAPFAYKIQQYYKNCCSIPRNNRVLFDNGFFWAMLVREIARQRPVQTPTSGHCRRPPALPAPLQPADADGTCRSAQRSPTNASKREGEDRSSRRPWSSKLEISPYLESKPEVLVKDQSKRGIPKCKSKPEMRVEAGSARQSRNLGFPRFCRL